MQKGLFYDAGISVRLWRSLHAGVAISIFDDTGAGDVTGDVPHPLQFNRPRSVTGELTGVTRQEIGQHVSAGWLLPASGGLDFLVFGGPSVFTTDQVFLTALTLSLDKEVFPFTSLAFPGATTQIVRENVMGYHAGVDMTWRFARHIGAGLLLRYATGKKNVTPSGGTPTEVEVGGLHAGGGLRLIF